MSLKPLKASEQRKINEKMQRRKKEILSELPPYTYIVSEGKETEPNYISGLVNAINEKYRDLSTVKRIMIKGTGHNTLGLLHHAERWVSEHFPLTEIVWLIYDKDDFPHDDFDNTEYSAQVKQGSRKYRVAWSNECIELWFLLHFQEVKVNTGRDQYRKKLKKYIPYRKNMPNIYELLVENTPIAIERAKRQYSEYGSSPPSQRCPATRMFELIEELQSYL